MTQQYSAFIIHSSATYPSMDIDVADVDQWHRDKGWNGIGYHYFIKRDGTIQKGRDNNVQGAHVLGYNKWKGMLTLGICMAGGLKEGTEQAEDNYTDAQYVSLTKLLTKLHRQNPETPIFGHNYFEKSRGCPCFDWPTYVEYINKAWASLYLPDNWQERNWKDGIDKDWNQVNWYKEVTTGKNTQN